MSEAKFTPGPWIVRKGHGLPAFVQAPRAPHMAYALDVCGDDYTGYGDAEQREINMYLIAAAPELYAALEDARQQMDAAETKLFLDLFNYEKIESALAKARGEGGT